MNVIMSVNVIKLMADVLNFLNNQTLEKLL